MWFWENRAVRIFLADSFADWPRGKSEAQTRGGGLASCSHQLDGKSATATLDLLNLRLAVSADEARLEQPPIRAVKYSKERKKRSGEEGGGPSLYAAQDIKPPFAHERYLKCRMGKPTAARTRWVEVWNSFDFFLFSSRIGSFRSRSYYSKHTVIKYEKSILMRIKLVVEP